MIRESSSGSGTYFHMLKFQVAPWLIDIQDLVSKFHATALSDAILVVDQPIAGRGFEGGLDGKRVREMYRVDLVP